MATTRRRPPTVLWAGALLSLAAGCNQYELFDLAGYEQAAFSNKADILFVIDNSPSMSEETGALGLSFNSFIDTLTSVEEGAEVDNSDLTHAVDNYLAYTQQRGRFLDYHLGITTTSVDYSNGTTLGIDPGEAGTLLGSPAVIAKGEDDVAGRFRENLLCGAAYWDTSQVPTDPGYECGDDPGDMITQEYLDCICGFGEWEGNSGSGDEEPLEATLTALCRSVPDPPEACFDPLGAFGNTDGSDQYVPLDGPDEDTLAEGFLRDGATTVVVVVSDEGDNSRRMAQGEADPQVYLDAYAEFGHNLKVVEIGPNWDPDSGNLTCATTAIPTWSVERMYNATQSTGGFYNVIVEESAGDCVATDFAQHLQDLGDLLTNLITAFQLQSIPDVGTIRVWVDDVEIDRAQLVEGQAGQSDAVYDEGWSYDSAQNSVTFWGTAIPDYNADVRIYYRPLEGKPRELPF